MLDRIPECKTLSERWLRERALNTSVIVRNSRKFQSARPPREEGATPARPTPPTSITGNRAKGPILCIAHNF